MNQNTILIVEDEVLIAELIDTYLQAAGFNTHIFYEGTQVVEWVRGNAPDVILLDLMLPGKNGRDICREIREFSMVPIIMTTAMVEEGDRILGLNIGADDYVCKPYSAKEVVARVKATIRRVGHSPTQEPAGLFVNAETQTVSYNGKKADLTAIEFNLFNLLYSRPGQIFSRSQILDLVYSDFRDVSDRTVDSHIRNLRKKLCVFALNNNPIHSVYGAGYKYELTA
ncbi:response regulator [Catenovulum sp. SX2]|uniref:response regulator n=1 Tax=Catenovulum sp. SX2 TaxID=3398614 RepID=UPI003F8254C4